MFRFCFIIFVFAFHNSSFSAGFKITLENGKFFGPGNYGEQPIQDGYLNNFIVTGPMTGHVPFANNGPEKPNVDGEYSHTGPVDGLLSDGTKINENVNAAFVLDVIEPETQESVKLFVGSVSRETVGLDDQGNLTFNLTAAFDSGFAQDVIQLPIQFITGLVEVPLSEKNKLDLPGGNDSAGPYPSGSLFTGRFGDIDDDGFLDGTFVLAGNTPIELLIAEGDPVLLVRPFTSDIPINSKEAAYHELNGLANNLLKPLIMSIRANDTEYINKHLGDVEKRIAAILTKLVKMERKKNSSSSQLTQIKTDIEQIKSIFAELKNSVSDEKGNLIKKIELAFISLRRAKSDLAKILGK